MVTSTSELSDGPDAVVDRLLDRRHAVAHRHLDRHRERDLAAGVLEQTPGVAAQMRAVDVFVAGPQQLGLGELEQHLLGVVPDAVRHHVHAVLAGERELLGVETAAERKRQQLILATMK